MYAINQRRFKDINIGEGGLMPCSKCGLYILQNIDDFFRHILYNYD